ncbi:hypothetical protein [uncultured Croceitalea sp.]|uniref:hypothetical protein n=1 Tax=uncultured Croceitalea sp. TaxID=1798908 RepID=UPI003305BB1F
MDYKKQMEKEVENKVKYYVTKIVKVIFFIVLALVLAFLIGYVVMRLWNWLMPELFGLPTVSYWQAVGVLVLAKIFFGFGSGNGPSQNKKSKQKQFSKKCGPMRNDFSEWKFYDQFWNEEGEKAFKAYVERMKQENETNGKEN